MQFRYQNGGEVLEGDQVLCRAERATVEFVVADLADHPEMASLLGKFPEGALVVVTENGGSILLPGAGSDLEFVARTSR